MIRHPHVGAVKCDAEGFGLHGKRAKDCPAQAQLRHVVAAGVCDPHVFPIKGQIFRGRSYGKGPDDRARLVYLHYIVAPRVGYPNVGTIKSYARGVGSHGSVEFHRASFRVEFGHEPWAAVIRHPDRGSVKDYANSGESHLKALDKRASTCLKFIYAGAALVRHPDVGPVKSYAGGLYASG